ncbi:MAG TPA: hypothetical protein PLH94_11670 [Fimbriimonadaceae bacterium]|nr:hypothetical protein [Fimbriimonadaceae bacterium]
MKLILAALASLATVSTAVACTIFVVSRNGMVLAGANEDYSIGERFEKHWVRFVPASQKGQLGYIGFGYNFSPFLEQAAINEAGLFFDYNALGKLDKPNEGKQPGGLPQLLHMIKTCRTVDEAVKYLGQYDIPLLSTGQMVLGDATGASAIIERHTVTARTRGIDFQIGTNFRTSTTPASEIRCNRYRTCAESLAKGQSVSIESVRLLLERTAPKNGGAISWYSSVCDLKGGRVYLFRKANFSRVAILDVKAELKKGARTEDMDALMTSLGKPYRAADD